MGSLSSTGRMSAMRCKDHVCSIALASVVVWYHSWSSRSLDKPSIWSSATASYSRIRLWVSVCIGRLLYFAIERSMKCCEPSCDRISCRNCFVAERGRPLTAWRCLAVPGNRQVNNWHRKNGRTGAIRHNENCAITFASCGLGN